MSKKMNDFMLKQLLNENQRLKQELELSKNSMKVSEACKALIEYCDNAEEPFDKSYSGENTFGGNSGGSGCCTVQ